MTLGVGVIGSGFVAHLHANAWRRVHGVDVEIVAVASAQRDHADAFAREFSVPKVHDRADDVLRAPDVDIVDCCIPNNLHAPVALDALAEGKHVVIEKPLTGAFARRADKTPQEMLSEAVAAADAIVAAADRANRRCCYAENWVYAPPFTKAATLLATAGGAILRIQGEESHSGTHSEPNKHWVTAGGGALLGKGCHPLGAALYLKRAEGARRAGLPILPRTVIAETRALTAVPGFDAVPTPIRTGYEDVEDFGILVCTFDDGTIAEIVGADTTLGGVRNRLTAYATNAVVEANLNPNTAVRAYAPDGDVLAGAYLSEKLETHAGWSQPSPDEDWMQGYPQEMQDFAEAIAHDRAPRSDAGLGRDVLVVTYGAYVAAAEGRRVDLSRYFAARP
jgi:predicted dehydrogenase